ncbi:MsnO8 family LLM class oxidoreductase [Oceanobacillus sp. FSL W8-0428]|uniref:MsnO8 family LLM class oxidoreductase n=1 Tax=Oceanobacillus TaxID=182709 RepID=UPI0030DAF6CB
MGYKLGILDQSPIFSEETTEEALEATVQLAQKAEEWGYNRFWVSEHHQSLDLAGSSPEVLIPYLLAKTSSIKIGSGGVMLQHYSPYKVAENFKVLSALAPERVELGVGKAPGGFSLSTNALQYGGAGPEILFDERFKTLQQFISDQLPEDHSLYGAKALPETKKNPSIYLLGASKDSARLAAEQRANFVFARFLNGNDEVLQEAVSEYRSIYPKGVFALAIASFAAETQAEAEKETSNYKIYKLQLESGRSISVQSPEQIELFRSQTDESFEVKEQEVELLAGSTDSIKEELDRLADIFQINEFILHTPIQSRKKRFKSFELLGQLTAPVLDWN